MNNMAGFYVLRIPILNTEAPYAGRLSMHPVLGE